MSPETPAVLLPEVFILVYSNPIPPKSPWFDELKIADTFSKEIKVNDEPVFADPLKG